MLIGAVIVSMVPYSQGGITVCPSTFDMVRGGGSNSTWLFMVNTFTGGACAKFYSTMEVWFWVLAGVALVALAVGLWPARRPQAGEFPYPVPSAYQASAAEGGQSFTDIPTQPQYAPGLQASPTPVAPPSVDLTQVPTPGAGFDWRLAVGAVGIVVALVVVSLLVQALSFLPGILQLILWAAVELTVVWQVLRYAAKGDPEKLARAERWNPAVVAGSGVRLAKAKWAGYQAARRQASASPWAPADTSPAASSAAEGPAPASPPEPNS